MTKENSAGIRRLFSWGPMIAIGIITSISIMALYMNVAWWPPTRSFSGLINQVFILMLFASVGYKFVMASLTGPMFLPLRWRPENPGHEQFLQYCFSCEGFKAPRSHHCQKCSRCVIKMDHHCPWINNCVGWANQPYFIRFLVSAELGCFYAIVILYKSLYSQSAVHLGLWSLVMFNIVLAVVVIIALGRLIVLQGRAILMNRTGIEDMIVAEAKRRREGCEETFRYPYDLGKWMNIQQVASWTCVPVGSGIEWAVAEECDQFSLTREQLQQHAEELARARKYTVHRTVSGSWLPLWSQGCHVCYSLPLTDVARIKLDVGDKVRVTRWRKHWLFGEKLAIIGEDRQDKNQQTKPEVVAEALKPCRVRGWFPRQCAVALTEQEDNTEQQQHMIEKWKSK